MLPKQPTQASQGLLDDLRPRTIPAHVLQTPTAFHLVCLGDAYLAGSLIVSRSHSGIRCGDLAAAAAGRPGSADQFEGDQAKVSHRLQSSIHPDMLQDQGFTRTKISIWVLRNGTLRPQMCSGQSMTQNCLSWSACDFPRWSLPNLRRLWPSGCSHWGLITQQAAWSEHLPQPMR